PVFMDSTLGELAVWMAEQATEDEPEAWLAGVAQGRMATVGEDALEATLLADMSRLLTLWTGVAAVLATLGAIGLAFRVPGHRVALLLALMTTNAVIYIIPPGSSPGVAIILLTVTLTGLLLLLSGERVERYIGFIVVLSFFTVVWEGSKAFAEAVGYNITVPAATWEHTAYNDLESALIALQNGEIDTVLADRNQLDELMPPYPPEDDVDADTLPYPELAYLTDFERERTQFGREVTPELARRVAVATTSEAAPTMQTFVQLQGSSVGAVTDSFVVEDFLTAEHQVVLLDFKISNDLNLPHLQSIAEALLQPARRNGPLLLIRILAGNALYTWTEAILGFVFGAMLGFLLGTVFAHVKLLQRSLMPYVIASQTIPIIALAPMIVIWLRDTHPILPVAVIASYLTFFPVTINTLRGLQSPDALSFDLMKSYAASPWQVMWKLRFPAALPYIFTALKVSATASVVGAIIGELPSGIRNGLGRAILDFSSDYSLISTPKLWGAIFMAALTGIVSYLFVLIVEMIVLRFQLSTDQR
ncbi:MAG: ABC transporter permease, partial [Chloroflexota bacterium]